MTLSIRPIREDDLTVVGEILDAAYGPGRERVRRVRRYRSLGEDTWLVALADGRAAGVAGAIDFGAYAYVGLVGVSPDNQRRGIARALMDSLLATLSERGCPTILLDASAAGAPLYRSLGFVEDDTVRLFSGPLVSRGAASGVSAMCRGDLAEVAELDRRVGGADRTRLLETYYSDDPSRAFVARDDAGAMRAFAFAQRGAVGPWVAESADDARRAFGYAMSRSFEGDTVVVAAPSMNTHVEAIVGEYGLSIERSLAHMRLGPLPARRRALIFGQASLAAG